MIVFIDLVGLDNSLAVAIGEFEKVIFFHTFQNVEIQGKNVVYEKFNTPINYSAVSTVIINRGSLLRSIGNEQAINILHWAHSMFTNATILCIVHAGDTLPRNIPIDIPFKFITPVGMNINKILFTQLGICIDYIEMDMTPENMLNTINSLKVSPDLTMIQSNFPEKMKILFVKRSILAFAPDELAEAINRYCSDVHVDVSWSAVEGYDVIHFHNIYLRTNHKRQLIQYHSEPTRCSLPNKKLPIPEKRLVLMQYHCTLKEYENMHPVRNVINFEQPLYDCKPTDLKKPLRIAYSPSVTVKVNEYYDKGYEQTKKILESIAKEGIEIDIIHGVPLPECISRKAKADIVIDECVTGSYHRSALEGLALGKMVVCCISKELEEKFINEMSKLYDDYEKEERQIPFENVSIDKLKEFLLHQVNRKSEVQEIGKRNRLWMEKYWRPADIARDFVNIYKTL